MPLSSLSFDNNTPEKLSAEDHAVTSMSFTSHSSRIQGRDASVTCVGRDRSWLRTEDVWKSRRYTNWGRAESGPS